VPEPRWRIPLGVIVALVGLGDLLPGPNQLGNHLRAVHVWQGYDCSKAASELGLAPRPLTETLQSAFDWLRETGHLKPKLTMVR
jgi:nucleoside-diphosphate-sugar epimerase